MPFYLESEPLDDVESGYPNASSNEEMRPSHELILMLCTIISLETA